MRILPLVFAAFAAVSCKGSGDTDATGETGEGGDAPATEERSTLTLPVTADEAIDGDLVVSIVTRGLVRSESETRLRAEVGGVVEAITARPGERVTKGQAIVQLAAYEFDFAIRRAEATVAEAQRRYEEDYKPDSILGQMPTPERLRAARIRSGLATAELTLEQAKYDKQRSTIRAPFDGIIDRFDVSIGERISAGQIVTTVVDAVNLRIEAAVLEHDIPYIRAGGEAQVSSAATPQRVARGRITSVLPIVDSTTRAGRAYVRLTGNDVFRPGMSVDVRLEAQRLANRRLVPSPAIIQRDGRDLVFVVKDGRAQWVYVVSGKSNGQFTEILPDTSGQYSGTIPVHVGDQVIVEGHLTLTHDAPVQVVARRETAIQGR